MARLIPAPIDGKNVNDDWITDDLGAVIVTEYGRNKGAFYFRPYGEPPIVLWEVIWREGSNAMFFRCHADNPSEKDMKPFIDYLKGIFEGENNLDYESVKATIGIYGNTVALHFHYEVDGDGDEDGEWDKESITENIMGRCREQIPHFDTRLDFAWERIAEDRCPLSMADPKLCSEIESVMENFETDWEISLEDYDITTAEDLI